MMAITTTSSRINSPTDVNVAKLPYGDGHDAVYITKVADLVNPSSSIKLLFSGYRPPNTLIKPLYRVVPNGSTDDIETFGFEYFPTDDASIPATTELERYFDYEYEVNGLELPYLDQLGLGKVTEIEGFKNLETKASYGKLTPKSVNNDTTTGHWELAGVVSSGPFSLYPEGFPSAIVEEVEKGTGQKFSNSR